LEMEEFHLSSLPDDDPEVSRFRAVWNA